MLKVMFYKIKTIMLLIECIEEELGIASSFKKVSF